MPNLNRKTLLRALCLTAAGSALFASLHVGSTSAYFTSTATVQVADIQAGTWSNNAGQSDAPEADSPVFLDEETIAPDTLLAAAPAPAALTAEEPRLRRPPRQNRLPRRNLPPSRHPPRRPPPERHDTAGRRCGPDSTWQRHDTGYRPQPQPRRLPHLRPRAGLSRGPVWRPLSGRCRILCRLCGGGAGGFARRPVRRKGRQRRPPAVQRRGWGHHRRGRAVCRV